MAINPAQANAAYRNRLSAIFRKDRKESSTLDEENWDHDTFIEAPKLTMQDFMSFERPNADNDAL